MCHREQHSKIKLHKKANIQNPVSRILYLESCIPYPQTSTIYTQSQPVYPGAGFS